MAKRPGSCRQCGRFDTVAGRISKRGLCTDCAMENMRTNAEQLALKQGPAYNFYLKRTQDGMERFYSRYYSK